MPAEEVEIQPASGRTIAWRPFAWRLEGLRHGEHLAAGALPAFPCSLPAGPRAFAKALGAGKAGASPGGPLSLVGVSQTERLRLVPAEKNEIQLLSGIRIVM